MPANAKTLFLEAAALTDPAARVVLLDERCGGDNALRARVLELLAANDRALANQGTRTVSNVGATVDPEAFPTADYPGRGEHIGAILGGKYKLIEEIGEGGMGSVYMAQQTEPVKRAVAVKVIKAGMDSKAVLARFEAERQALAMMDHPNIARVLDAGTTESGRPYFVMELVKGIPITQFCDERKLTPRQRLELFIPVCQAIQHAHQKGVIHRDIKPGNVLVALYDDRPVPKVIDFGVAKATGQSLTDQTLMTGYGAVVGTPEYMSPEQANLNNLDVDTRSDVYSLGVLLYELLTGSTPVDRKSLGKAALLEILRIVREVDVPKLSAKLSTIDTLPSVAANRGIEPAKLSKLLKGELDWLVLKALEKDRTRRYETANGFAADVQRYLSGEPVQAVPPSAGYRMGKFLRRHRGLVAASTAVLLTLLAGLSLSSYGFYSANLEREKLDLSQKKTLEEWGRAESAALAEKEARGELQEQFQKLQFAESEASAAFKKSEALRLATTALLKKPQNHELSARLAGEAVRLSTDAATYGTAIVAIEGMPSPKPFDVAEIPHPQIVESLRVPFLSSEWIWYHPDGKRVFALNNDHHAIVVHDAETLKPIRTISVVERGPERKGLIQLHFEPRGRWFVGIDAQGAMKAWDTATGKVVGTADTRGNPQAVQFHSGSDSIAIVGTTGEKGNAVDSPALQRVAVYALPGFEKRFEFEAPERFRAVAFSRDGTKLAACSIGKRTIRAWDLPTKKLLLEERESDRIAWPALVFSHDGTKLIDVVPKGLSVWDLADRDNQRLILFPDHHSRGSLVLSRFDEGEDVCTDADGTKAVFSPSISRRTLNSHISATGWTPARIFDLKKMEWGKALDNGEDTDTLFHVLSADGRRVASLFRGNTLAVFDTATGNKISTIQRPGHRIEGIAISPDGSAIVSDGLSRLWRWDEADRGLLPSLDLVRAKESTLVTADGERLVVFRGDGRIETFDSGALRSLSVGSPSLFPRMQNGYRSSRVLADGKRILILDEQKHEVVLYTDSGEVIARYGDRPEKFRADQDKSKWIVSPHAGKRFLLPNSKNPEGHFEYTAYDSDSGKSICTIDLGAAATGVHHCALSADGRRLAIVADIRPGRVPRDTSIAIWNLDTGALEGTIPGGEDHTDGGEAFNSSGTRLVSWRAGRVAIWDVSGRIRIDEFQLCNGLIDRAAISNDGRWIATCTKTEFAIWNATSGKNAYRIPLQQHSCDALAFVASDSTVMVDRGRKGRSGIDLYPVNVAAHFSALGLGRLDELEKTEFSFRFEKAKR